LWRSRLLGLGLHGEHGLDQHGSGFLVNHIQYQNNSAADFGVNYAIDSTQPDRWANFAFKIPHAMTGFS
jgi:hypothetical protein